MKTRRVIISVLLLLRAAPAEAAPATAAPVRPFLCPLFASHMVLQRDVADPVWGWAEPGVVVTVSVGDKPVTATADADGRWQAKLAPMPAGGPVTLKISSLNHPEMTLDDVLVGDVWLCSGQSNMTLNLNSVDNAKQEIADADHPKIRLFTVPTKTAGTPQTMVGGDWSVCAPQTVPGFSATAYFFGRDLNAKLNIPIGLIHSSVGGTPAESWTSETKLRTLLPEFGPQLDALDKVQRGPTPPPGRPTIERDTNCPSVLYNAMIHPLIPFAIKGVVWYQGENNAHSPRDDRKMHDIDGPTEYRTLLPAMITDWRDRWGQGNFPFLIVQLAGFSDAPPNAMDDAWAELRAAQWDTYLNTPSVGIMTAVDIGEPTNIHPRNKQEVGRRLALVAEHDVYGIDVTAYGPVYKSMVVDGNTVRVGFDRTGRGLKSAKPKVEGFAVAGTDGKFFEADARIEGNMVIVSSPKVAHPTQVQYAWGGFVPNTLQSEAGLPAFPFRASSR
jgi:sialate O-acetylesterase